LLRFSAVFIVVEITIYLAKVAACNLEQFLVRPLSVKIATYDFLFVCKEILAEVRHFRNVCDDFKML